MFGDELRRAHDAVVARVALDHGGEVVKGTGDGAMVVFGGAANALAAAVSIQQGIELQNRGRSELLAVRIGLSLGDLVYESGDLHGLATNEAARLCAGAEPDGILVSDVVRVVAGSRTQCDFVDRRDIALKGFSAPVSAWRVLWEPVPADAIAGHTYLRGLDAWADAITIGHFNTVGVGDGWSCLEVGVGAGSIARWLGDRVGTSGSVVATDIDLRHLTDLPANVEARQHDLMSDELDAGAYDLVHCRSLLAHTADPSAGLARMADAVARGGWLVIEENDVGLAAMRGIPEAARATKLLLEIVSRLSAAGVMDAHLGRNVPGLVHELGLEDFGADAVTGIGSPGDPAYDAMRLAWPNTRRAAAMVGIEEADLACLDSAFESPSNMMVGMTLFAAWGRKPH